MKLAFANTFSFDPAKPLVVPYATYPHGPTGVQQRVDRASASAFANDIAAAQAAGAPGLPVYVGHPDVPDLAARFPDKSAHGWISRAEALDDGVALHVAWNEAPAAGAFIYFSPYWAGPAIAAGMAHIDELRSIGLTNRPNVTRFRLPNEAGEERKEPRMKKLLMLLSLPETATEDEAAAALQALQEELTALKRKGEETGAALAAANTARDEATAGFANERAARIGLTLDCAIADGRVTPATRPVWEARLRKDFANEALALGQADKALKTRSALANEAADTTPAAILGRYEAMTDGPEKRAFLRLHAQTINNARCAHG